MAGNVDAMRKPDLMKYAASLGVATRKEGTKQWRQVADVRADCKLREAAQQQHSPAHAGGADSASSSQATPSAPSTGAPTQAVRGAALELGVRITIIPYTPPHALGQWAITAYGPEDAGVAIYLGNNDVHYVYLPQGIR